MEPRRAPAASRRGRSPAFARVQEPRGPKPCCCSERRRCIADDKSEVGGQDRARVAGGQDYETRHFAEQNGITIEQAEQLIQRHGNNREELERAAQQMKG